MFTIGGLFAKLLWNKGIAGRRIRGQRRGIVAPTWGMVHLLAFLLTASCPASAQHTGHQTMLPVVVDGSKTPDLIPDQLAYRHLLMALAELQHPPAEAVGRRIAHLAGVGLSAADRQNLISAMSGVREQLDEIYLATEQAAVDTSLTSAGKDTAIASLRAQQEVLLDATADKLKTALTNDGWLRLDAYVKDHVKRRIVIYGSLAASK